MTERAEEPVTLEEAVEANSAFSEFLLPIEGADGACGPSLRYAGVYDSIREARRQDEASLPQGVWESELKQADWMLVERLCSEVLKTKSKDLNVAAWLAEAWLVRDGASGLADGLRLITALSSAFWDGIHPPIEEDDTGQDLEFRASPFVFMVGEFPIRLRLSPLTEPSGADARKMCLDDWDNALRLENLALREPELAKREAGRKADRAQFDASVAHTPTDLLKAKRLDIVDASKALAVLDEFLDKHCGNAAPSFAPIRDVLDAMKAVLDTALTERGWSPATLDAPRAEGGPATDLEADDSATSTKSSVGVLKADQNEKEEESMSSNGSTEGGSGSGPIAGRADAYQRLAEIADYLMRTEPHSPVPYLIRRAVDWGDMSFGELLMVLMSEDGDKARLLRLLGLDDMGKRD